MLYKKDSIPTMISTMDGNMLYSAINCLFNTQLIVVRTGCVLSCATLVDFSSSPCRTFPLHQFLFNEPSCCVVVVYSPLFCRRGRDTGYPVPPAHLPACSFPAPGS